MSSPDPLEFARVHEAYHARMRAYAARLLGPDDADDVVQDVFLKIDRSLASLADPSRLGSWIYRVTLNTVRDAIRKRASSRERPSVRPCAAPGGGEAEADVVEATAARTRTPEEDAMRREMIACYLDYVDRLPVTYHDAYVLREIEELTNEEVAARLSLPLTTIKMRLHRARALLHAQLTRDCQLYSTAHGELLGEPKARGQRVD